MMPAAPFDVLQIEIDDVPGNCLSLNDIMLGRDGHRDWIDRFVAFSDKLTAGACEGDDQEQWLMHVKYAMREDTIRGYLKNRVAGSAYAKSVVDRTMTAIERKLSA